MRKVACVFLALLAKDPNKIIFVSLLDNPLGSVILFNPCGSSRGGLRFFIIIIIYFLVQTSKKVLEIWIYSVMQNLISFSLQLGLEKKTSNKFLCFYVEK